MPSQSLDNGLQGLRTEFLHDFAIAYTPTLITDEQQA